MYTIEELEHIVTDGSNSVDITDIVDQLLDTMRALADAQRRIAAAAVIEPLRVSMSPSSEYARGYNEARQQFRAALELE